MKDACRRTALAAALVALGIPLAAQAQNASSGTSAATAATPGAMHGQQNEAKVNEAKISAADRQFVHDAAIAGLGEVAKGKLAEQKAQDPQVRQFGERMVHDHSQANDRLKQIAKAKGIELPRSPGNTAQQDMNKLEKLSGDDFDRMYIEQQLSAHKKAIDEFRNEANAGKDADLRTFARDTLPTLEKHYDLAQSAMQDVLGKSASTAPPSNPASNASVASTGSKSGASTSTSNAGLEAAKKATGASAAHAAEQAGMPVPKTGM
ncbi:MAG TPA: DUF4142 domain-containing protein [Burkholderiales bacterium]|nr:DUF4142 domain-containing protein [Burkholderiales bacterium]